MGRRLVLALVAVGLLAAQAVVGAATTTLRVSHAWGGDFLPRQLEFDRKFMARHPDIRIEYENVGWDEYNGKYLVQAAAGTLPDVMYINGSWFTQWVKLGAFIDLEPYIRRDADFRRDDLVPALMRQYQDAQGRQRAISYGAGTIILFYNKDMFDRNGLSYPDMSWTYEGEFLRAAQKLTVYSADGRLTQAGFAGISPSWQTDGVLLRPWGGRLVNDQETEALIGQPGAIRAIEYWASLHREYRVTGGNWLSGTTGMMLSGTWDFTPTIAAHRFAWDIAHVPAGPVARSTTYSSGSGYAITRDSKHPDQAWLYLKEYLSTENQAFMWGVTRRDPPSRRSAWSSFINQPGDPEHIGVVFDAIAYGAPIRPRGPASAKILEAARKSILEALAGRLNPRAAAEDAQRAITGILPENQ